MGGLWGSFANVCIYRLPQIKEWLLVDHTVLNVKNKLSWYDNIPILSYLLFKENVGNVKRKFHIQYPLVELLSVLSFVISLLFLWNNNHNTFIYNFSLNIYHNFFY